MLSEVGCRERQRRLLGGMETLNLDVAIISDPRHVYYFSGILETQNNPTAFVIWADGQTGLVTGVSQEGGAADSIRVYETYSATRVLEHLVGDAAKLLGDVLDSRKTVTRRIGIESASLVERLGTELWQRYDGAEKVELLPTLYEMFEIKDADEIALLKEGITLCETAYQAAVDTISPGLTELDVYNAMYSAIVKEAGTSVPFAGDFSCGLRSVTEGGPPTRRVLQDGDLYVLDIFPNWQGYQADMCRTFAVSTVSEDQQRAWELVQGALEFAVSQVRPGLEARELHRRVAEYLEQWDLVRGTFFHHTGHGIGMHGHERPRIHSGSPHEFKVGQMIVMEPGVYSGALQGGLRLENVFLVHEDRLENLCSFPMVLRS